MSDFWNEEKEATLDRLWAEGMTAKEIGVVLGCSRSAILGKAHRRRLSSRAHNRLVEVRVKVAKPAPVKKEPEPVFIPVANADSMLDLGKNDCKFPMGDMTDPGFGFCGAPNDGKHPYCAHHAKIVYVPGKPYNPALARKPKVRI